MSFWLSKMSWNSFIRNFDDCWPASANIINVKNTCAWSVKLVTNPTYLKSLFANCLVSICVHCTYRDVGWKLTRASPSRRHKKMIGLRVGWSRRQRFATRTVLAAWQVINVPNYPFHLLTHTHDADFCTQCAKVTLRESG